MLYFSLFVAPADFWMTKLLEKSYAMTNNIVLYLERSFCLYTWDANWPTYIRICYAIIKKGADLSGNNDKIEAAGLFHICLYERNNW